MKGKLIGVMHKYGVFKPKDKDEELKYDNVVLYVLEKLAESSDPSNASIGDGFYLHTLKIKTEKVQSIIDYPIKHLDELNKFKDCEITWFYNQFGNVDQILLTEG